MVAFTRYRGTGSARVQSPGLPAVHPVSPCALPSSANCWSSGICFLQAHKYPLYQDLVVSLAEYEIPTPASQFPLFAQCCIYPFPTSATKPIPALQSPAYHSNVWLLVVAYITSHRHFLLPNSQCQLRCGKHSSLCGIPTTLSPSSYQQRRLPMVPPPSTQHLPFLL